MRHLFVETDVLVDASQRDDTSRPLVPNPWIGWLPSHAVICDCVVDPYLLDEIPPTVRSVEGIPRGDLDRYVFEPADPAWCETIPAGVPTEERRHVVSCYSWPGVHPQEGMELYGKQMAPLLEVLVRRHGAAGLRENGEYQERALARARLTTWLRRGAPSRHGARGPLGSREPS
jgi:alanine dehydrogenase